MKTSHLKKSGIKHLVTFWLTSGSCLFQNEPWLPNFYDQVSMLKFGEKTKILVCNFFIKAVKEIKLLQYD
jgi:hypothetical protein